MDEMHQFSDDGKNDHVDPFYDANDDAPPLTWCQRICPLISPPHYINTMEVPRIVISNAPTANLSNLHCFPTNYVSTTKYTLLTFLPKNLYEQFQKAANFYFLIIAIVVSIPGISTIEPYTSIMPLVFVLSVTAIKEAYEDYHRHLSDRETNNSRVDVVLPDGSVVEKVWSDLCVGDLCQVYDGQALPADLILVSSSEADGSANIMTANLDGETNLKTRRCLKATQHLTTPKLLSNMKCKVRCEPPSADLNTFEGLWLDEETGQHYPLTHEQLLLRGGCRYCDACWNILVLDDRSLRLKNRRLVWSLRESSALSRYRKYVHADDDPVINPISGIYRLGIDLAVRRVIVNKDILKLQVWDADSLEHGTDALNLARADIVLTVFNVYDKESFERLPRMVDRMRKQMDEQNSNAVMLLLADVQPMMEGGDDGGGASGEGGIRDAYRGGEEEEEEEKKDSPSSTQLHPPRVISYKDAKQYANTSGMVYLECDASNQDSVDQAFVELAKECLSFVHSEETAVKPLNLPSRKGQHRESCSIM